MDISTSVCLFHQPLTAQSVFEIVDAKIRTKILKNKKMKEKYIQELEKLDEKVLEKLLLLSKSKKAKDYLTNPLLWVTVKKFFGL